MSSEAILKHRWVIKNGVRHYMKPVLLQQRLLQLEGKSGYDVIEEAFDPNTRDQYGYYFGGIIRATCMQTEQFSAMEEDEIDAFFRDKFLTYQKAVTFKGQPVIVTRRIDIKELGKRKMAEYITKVIAYLATEENIIVPEPSDFILKRYTTKERKAEE